MKIAQIVVSVPYLDGICRIKGHVFSNKGEKLVSEVRSPNVGHSATVLLFKREQLLPKSYSRRKVQQKEGVVVEEGVLRVPRGETFRIQDYWRREIVELNIQTLILVRMDQSGMLRCHKVYGIK